MKRRITVALFALISTQAAASDLTDSLGNGLRTLDAMILKDNADADHCEAVKWASLNATAMKAAIAESERGEPVYTIVESIHTVASPDDVNWMKGKMSMYDKIAASQKSMCPTK